MSHFSGSFVVDQKHDMEQDVQILKQTPAERRRLKAAEWEIMRPMIEQLYIEKNQTFKDVATALDTEFGFLPSKRQFDRRIDYWGLKKYTTRPQRLAILDILNGSENVEIPDANFSRIWPVQLNNQKVGRWKKEAQSIRRTEQGNERWTLESGMRVTSWEEKHHGTSGNAMTILEEIDDVNDREDGIDMYFELENTRRGPKPASLNKKHDDNQDDSEITGGSSNVIEDMQNTPSFNVEYDQRDSAVLSALERLNTTLIDPQFAKELGVTKTIYDAADIPGSPKLSRLFEAMKIDQQVQEMSLDIQDHPSNQDYVSPCQLIRHAEDRTAKLPVHGQNGKKVPKALIHSRKRQRRLSFTNSYFEKWLFHIVQNSVKPLDEIDPLPNPRFVNQYDEEKEQSMPPLLPLQQQKIECESRLEKLKLCFPPQSSIVIDDMWRLAYLYSELGEFEIAESLYQHVAVSKSDTLGDDHVDTLAIYLSIVQAKMNQQQYKLAAKIHYGLHRKILSLVACDSRLAILSACQMMELESKLGHYEESERLSRELAQICLSKFGLQNISTWYALRSLSLALSYRSDYSGGEHLYSLADELRHKISECSDIYACKNLGQLAYVLTRQGRYEDGYKLAREALQKAKTISGIDGPEALVVSGQIGEVLRLQGKFKASEKVLRDTLARLISRYGPDSFRTTVCALHLALTLMGLEKWEEAKTLLEQGFQVEVNTFGFNHDFTDSTLEILRFCYAKLGLASDESTLQGMIEASLEGLEIGTHEDDESDV